jgi:Ubiquitin carboxyl-terminal hydrolase
VEQYASLLRQLWGGSAKTVKPQKLKALISRRAPQFSGYRQQDAQELLAFLLDGLHEDLNRVRHKEYVEVADFDGTNDPEAAEDAWENHLKRNRSVIVDLFHGQLRSELTCPRCERVSVTFDPFAFLTVPLPLVNSRVYSVVVVRQAEIYYPIKYSVRVENGLRLVELRQQLACLAGFAVDRLAFADVYNNRISRFRSVRTALSQIHESDNLYG